jgi:hypothetical protein
MAAAAGAGAYPLGMDLGMDFDGEFRFNNFREATDALRERKSRLIPENKLTKFYEQMAAIDCQPLPWNVKEKIKAHFSMPTHPTARIVKGFFRRRSQWHLMEDSMLNPMMSIRNTAGGAGVDSDSLYDLLKHAVCNTYSGFCRGTYSRSMTRVLREAHYIMSQYPEMRSSLYAGRNFEKDVISYLEEKD